MATTHVIFPKTSGFTLIELLAALAIFAILLTLAVPSINHLIIQNRTESAVNSIVHALYYARHEAILRNEKLIFCKSTDGKACNGHWRDGQILFNTQKQILRAFPAIPAKDDLVWKGGGSELDDQIVWLPTGYTNGQRGRFYYCVSNMKDSRSIVLLDTGRAYVSNMDGSDYQQYCLK